MDHFADDDNDYYNHDHHTTADNNDDSNDFADDELSATTDNNDDANASSQYWRVH